MAEGVGLENREAVNSRAKVQIFYAPPSWNSLTLLVPNDHANQTYSRTSAKVKATARRYRKQSAMGSLTAGFWDSLSRSQIPYDTGKTEPISLGKLWLTGREIIICTSVVKETSEPSKLEMRFRDPSGAPTFQSNFCGFSLDWKVILSPLNGLFVVKVISCGNSL